MFLHLPGRLAKALLRLSGGGGVARERKAAVTQKDLGSTIGMSRESTNRQLRLWAENKWIRLERGGIASTSRSSNRTCRFPPSNVARHNGLTDT
jgi:CRP-like cAMP-binding protein